MNSLPKSIGGDIIFISQQEYESMLNRIEQLQTAQDYNQKIIDRLMQRMQQLEQIYFAQQQHQQQQQQNNNRNVDCEMNMRS